MLKTSVVSNTTQDGKETGLTTSIPGFSAVKKRVFDAAKKVDMLSVMSMNRKARRGIAKANGIKNIIGSTKPFVGERT